MDKKGFLPFFFMTVILVVFCTVIILFFFALSFFAKLQIQSNTEREEKFITPFMVGYTSSTAVFDGKSFFQEMSYLASGELFTPTIEKTMDEYASRSANDYLIGFYDKGLLRTKVLDEKVGGAVIPIFTFEKKQEALIITSS